MNPYEIYSDISTRTHGDLYVGVVGPVRVGKSTFITKFMEQFVLPNIDSANLKSCTLDELPQSADGATIMTTQPKFIPAQAVRVNLGDNVHANVKLIDCVGYLVAGAQGHIVDGKPRMVKTPWDEKEMTFEEASEIGTRRVVTEHSTVAILLTTDASFGDIDRASFEPAEARLIQELRANNKPFVLVVNSIHPDKKETLELVEALQKKYNVATLAVNVANLEEKDVANIFTGVLQEFPITSVQLNLPQWIEALPFNSDNKYSGASFAIGVTYILGAIEFMDLELKDKVVIKANEYSAKGYRVLLLAKGNNVIKADKYEGKLKPLALIVLRDHIKDDAMQTFAWFKENHVDIKVISGDNALTVSEIAKQAGIDNAERYVSLEGLSLEEVKNIALQYTVFGRVTPEQKEAIVEAYKQDGKTVAMTGDGVNDILALKHADCSIAMNSGSQAAKNISHVVLLNNDFSTMPDIVGEGRRVINNLQRTGSLFLTKTFFAIFFSSLFWIVSIFTAGHYSYPFSTGNMMIWEIAGIGLSAFFIALEPNSAPIKHGFLRNILKRAIPSVALLITGVGCCYMCYALHTGGLLYTGVADFGYSTSQSNMMRFGATGMAVLAFTGLSFVVLYLVCRPFSKYRLIVFISATIFGAVAYLITALTTPARNMFQIDFTKMTYENLLDLFVIIFVLGAGFIIGQDLILSLRRKKKNDQNQ